MTPESRVQPKIRDNIMKMLILWRREWTRSDFGMDETVKNVISLFSEISSWAQKPEAPRGKEGQWKAQQEDSSQRIVHSWANRNVTPLGVNGHISIFFEFCSKVLTVQQVDEPCKSSNPECRNYREQRVVWRPDWRGSKPVGFNDRGVRAWLKEEEAKGQDVQWSQRTTAGGGRA